LQVGDAREAVAMRAALVLAGIALILFSSPSVTHAAGSSINAKDWTISTSWSNPDQPSGSATTVTLNVYVSQTVYNLQVTVSGQDLTINSNLGSGNSYSWDQLNEGDTRQIQFVVTTPSQAPVGNRYNVTVQAQSYSTPPGTFGLRSPFDSPADKGSTSFLLQVTPFQVITPQGGSIDWGSISLVAVAAIIFAVAALYLWSRSSW